MALIDRHRVVCCMEIDRSSMHRWWRWPQWIDSPCWMAALQVGGGGGPHRQLPNRAAQARHAHQAHHQRLACRFQSHHKQQLNQQLSTQALYINIYTLLYTYSNRQWRTVEDPWQQRRVYTLIDRSSWRNVLLLHIGCGWCTCTEERGIEAEDRR